MGTRRVYKAIGKRLLDLAIVIPISIVACPITVFIALLSLVFHGNDIFFKQQRPGLYGKPFTLIKFRTMRHAVDSNGSMLGDELRLTLFGRILRASSLDELPQLLNVIKGEMSLVGPRPLLMHYMQLYSPEQGRRHEVLPGITGLAQVNGRNLLSWEERFALDVFYVDHLSLGLDLSILIKTVLHVVMRTGIRSADAATMKEFTGTKHDVRINK